MGPYMEGSKVGAMVPDRSVSLSEEVLPHWHWKGNSVHHLCWKVLETTLGFSRGRVLGGLSIHSP